MTNEQKTTFKFSQIIMQELDNQNTTPDTSNDVIDQEWWQEHFHEPMPEEVAIQIRKMVRTEARRLNVASALLSPQKMARIEDARRLAETKLRNIESKSQV